MKLKLIDKKILANLYIDSRKTNLELSKELKFSRQQISSKIKLLTQENYIKRFTIILNYKKLGYNNWFSILIKLDKSSSYKEFIKEIPKQNLISFGDVFTKYDLYLNLIFKDEKDFYEKMYYILNSKKVLKYELFKPLYLKMFPIRFLNLKDYNFLKENKINFNLDFEIKKDSLDQNDFEILKILSKNSREKIINISKKLNISSELTLYKIKKLKEKKIIAGTKTIYNLEKFNLNYTLILVKFFDLSEDIKEKLNKFTKESKFIENLAIMDNPNFNCNIQLFHQEIKDLKNEIINFKSKFKDQIFNLEIIFIGEESFLNPVCILE